MDDSNLSQLNTIIYSINHPMPNEFLEFLVFLKLFKILLIVIINSNQIQMKNLAYIPTKTDKNQLYAELEGRKYFESAQYTQQMNKVENVQTVVHNNERKLKKQQLDDLLRRLVINTKKQYNIEQQKTHILAANLQLKRKRENGEKVENRLQEYGKKIQEKKIELANHYEAQQRQKYFRDIPEITSKAKNLNQRAIDKRLNQLLEERINKRSKLQQKYHPSFQPEINPQSQFINDLQNYGDLQNRMQIRQKQANKRKEILAKQVEQKQKEILTFHPMINQKSKQIAERLTQRPPLSAKTYTIASKITQIDKQIYPFAPTINKNASQLMLKKEGSDEDCFRRLYNNAKDMLAKQKDKVQKRNRAYTFQPVLNDKSRKLVASSVQKKSRQQKINDFSQKGQEQYEEIKIGNKQNQTRVKCYSVRNQSNRNSQQKVNNKYEKGFYQSGKNFINFLR